MIFVKQSMVNINDAKKNWLHVDWNVPQLTRTYIMLDKGKTYS